MFTSFCLVAAMQFIMDKLRDIFLPILSIICDLCLLLENASKSPKIYSINSYILLKGHNVDYDKFFIFLSKRRFFKLHLKIVSSNILLIFIVVNS